MWSTSYGDRTLTKAEAAVFLEGVAYMRDMISVSVELDESHQVGLAIFDRLQPTQQLTALHTVTMALLKPDIAPPPLSANLEATVYAIYQGIISLVEVEIDACQQGFVAYDLRNAILQARCQPIGNDTWNESSCSRADLPSCQEQEIDQWELEIELLADQILWDRDFELEDLIADQDPARISAVKDYLGIGRDYFSIPAPDSRSEQYLRLDRELVDLRKQSPTLFR